MSRSWRKPKGLPGVGFLQCGSLLLAHTRSIWKCWIFPLIGVDRKTQLERFLLITNAPSCKSPRRPFEVSVDVGLNADEIAELLRILNEQAARCGLVRFERIALFACNGENLPGLGTVLPPHSFNHGVPNALAGAMTGQDFTFTICKAPSGHGD